MQRIIARLVADAALVGTLMFVAAGTFGWRHAWVLLASMLCIRIAGAVAVYRVNPALLLDRARLPVHAAQPWTDRLLLAGLLATGMLGIPLVAALDAFHWHLFATPVAPLTFLGGVLFALGWTLKSLALHANAFAIPVVRVQHEQVLVDSGVYAVVRHPFYAADPLIFVGSALWLGSWFAVLIAAIPMGFMIARLVLEERFLQRTLPGYRDYAVRVPFRLVPGVW